jgi:prepilin signal peptidase PulO-like enzyme (type II secretory pathway)
MLVFIELHQALIIGLIFMAVLGPAVGNYACSVVYRLPRGQTPFERHPFCGHCNADLKPIDLSPILSWCLTRGRCRYCRAPIPSIYTFIELVCGAVFIAYFLKFNMSEKFLLYASYGTLVVILAAIEWQQRWLSSSIYGYALTCVALVRTLDDFSIYGWIKGAFFMLVIMLAFMRIAGNKKSPFDCTWVWWFVLMGALLPMAQWGILAAAYAIKLCLPKRWRVLFYSGLALALPLIPPSLI